MGRIADLADRLWVAWQPVRSLVTGEVYGHEALIRGPVGTPLEGAEAIIRHAADAGDARELERLCRVRAFAAAASALPPDQVLFLNLDTRFLDLPLMPEPAPWPPEQTVIEVSERFPLRDLPLLATHIALWRNEGFRVAIDDFGAGYAGLATLAAIRPDVVKLDRSLVSGVMRDRWQRELVSAMVAVLEPLGVTVIAEGIGHADDLPALVAIGVRFGQGFALGRPQARPASAPLRLP